MKNYRRAKKSIDVSVGDSVRIIRELQELGKFGVRVKTNACGCRRCLLALVFPLNTEF